MLTVVMAAAIKNIPPNDNTVNMTTVSYSWLPASLLLSFTSFIPVSPEAYPGPERPNKKMP